MNLEVNGIKYEGVLLANPGPISPSVKNEKDLTSTIVTATTNTPISNCQSSGQLETVTEDRARSLISS